MAFPSFLFLISLFVSISFSESKLSIDYYKKSCPVLEDIIRETVTSKQITNPTTAAATLRVFFHDCMVGGCDASVLISSNAVSKAERDADINLSLPGDAFDVIVRAKTALELSCPGIVSCADILALATRNAVSMVGGPFYTVKLGRKDSLVSNISAVEGNMPRANMTMDEIIRRFGAKKFTVREMVALIGATPSVSLIVKSSHTGFSATRKTTQQILVIIRSMLRLSRKCVKITKRTLKCQLSMT